MPEDVLWINFEFIDEKKRKISFICDIIEK